MEAQIGEIFVTLGSGWLVFLFFFCAVRFLQMSQAVSAQKRGRKSKLDVSLLDYTHGRGIRTPCWRRYEAQDNKTRGSQAAD